MISLLFYTTQKHRAIVDITGIAHTNGSLQHQRCIAPVMARWLISLLLTWLCSVALLATSDANPPKPKKTSSANLGWYVVQPGDSCWSIAEKLFGDGRKYTLIHRYNDLGPMPHILKPGQRLRVPGGVQQSDALVTWLKRLVQVRSPRSDIWRDAYQKMQLWQLYRLRTGRDSLAGLEFIDRSYLYLRELASIVIYGRSAQQIRAQRLVQRTVQIEEGTVRGGLASLDQAATKHKGLPMRTPSANITLHSRSSQIEVDANKTTLVSVYDGSAGVRAQGSEVKVPSDYGTFVKMGQRPAKPRKLPSPPTWQDKIRHAVVMVTPRSEVPFVLRWQPIAKAKSYRIEWSLSEKFRPLLRSVNLPAIDKTEYAIPGLQANQNYYARISVRDRDNLESRYSATYRIQVIELELSRLPIKAADGVEEVSGWLRVSAPSEHAEQVQVSINGAAYRSLLIPIRLLQPGLYVLRFRPNYGTYAGEALQIRLLAVSGQLQIPDEPIDPIDPAQSFHSVKLQLTDSKGQPAVLPDLQLQAFPGGSLQLVARGRGLFEATLPRYLKHPMQNIWIIASWPGGELARAQIAVKPPPKTLPLPTPPSPPPVIKQPLPPTVESFVWPDLPTFGEWFTRAAGLPSRNAQPFSHFGLSSFLQTRPHYPQQDQAEEQIHTHLRFAFRGEVALWHNRIGVDIDVPWLQINLAQDGINNNRFGDLRIGGKFVALQREALLLSPSLRIRLPTRGFERTTIDASFEPALLLTWKPLDWLYLHTNQILAIHSNFAAFHSLFYSSSYIASAYPHKLFSLGIELNMSFGLFGTMPVSHKIASNPIESTDVAGEIALGLSGVSRLQLQRLRISLIAGGAAHKIASQWLTIFNAGLSFDIGFN